MDSTHLFLLSFAVYGFAFALMNDKIPVVPSLLRRLPIFRSEDGRTFFTRMFECSYCTGFHVGWLHAVGVAIFAFDPIHWSTFHWITAAFAVSAFAFAMAAWCYLIDTAIERLERV